MVILRIFNELEHVSCNRSAKEGRCNQQNRLDTVRQEARCHDCDKGRWYRNESHATVQDLHLLLVLYLTRRHKAIQPEDQVRAVQIGDEVRLRDAKEEKEPSWVRTHSVEESVCDVLDHLLA